MSICLSPCFSVLGVKLLGYVAILLYSPIYIAINNSHLIVILLNVWIPKLREGKEIKSLSRGFSVGTGNTPVPRLGWGWCKWGFSGAEFRRACSRVCTTPCCRQLGHSAQSLGPRTILGAMKMFYFKIRGKMWIKSSWGYILLFINTVWKHNF